MDKRTWFKLLMCLALIFITIGISLLLIKLIAWGYTPQNIVMEQIFYYISTLFLLLSFLCIIGALLIEDPRREK